MEFHEAADIFPLMQGKEFGDLAKDIERQGLLEPIWTYQDKIIDGRNRYRACMIASVEPRYREWDGEGSMIDFIVSLNLHRRHLNTSQRAMIANDISQLKLGEKKSDTQICAPSQSDAAAMMNVGKRNVQKARVVSEHGVPELADAVRRGKMALDRAEKIARLPKPEQKEEMERPKTKKQKPLTDKQRRMSGTGKECTEALQFSIVAISHLERIRDDDPKREEALVEVLDWINRQLEGIRNGRQNNRKHKLRAV